MPNAPLESVLRYLGRTTSPQTTDAHLLDLYARQHDESAFELLVRRHSALVLGVCRRVLRREQDAEDAFQATFLVLARKAGSLGKCDSVGGWLHRVAYRAALHARAGAARQADRERAAASRPLADSAPGPADEAERRELGQLIDVEVGRLPEKYRVPFVLCHLGGKSNAEAARELGCPVGTLESRLTRARQRLRDRLAQHGAAPGTAAWPVLAPLVGADANIVKRTASIGKTVGVASAPVVVLAQGVLKGMAMSKYKAIASLVLIVGVMGGGAGGLTYLLAGEREEATPVPRVEQGKRLDNLVRNLGSESFAEREAATKALEAVGEPALDRLRSAAKSTDLETRRRAERLVEKIERVAAQVRALAPRLVHLKYKDAPLEKATADFCTQSGYEIILGDRDGDLKPRKITLDTGRVPFWRALHLFCASANLQEQEPIGRVQAAVSPGPFMPPGRDVEHLNGLIILVDGRPENARRDDRSSIRIRALPADSSDGPPRPGRSFLNLTACVEPRLRWLRPLGVRVDRAVDERGRALVAPGDVPPEGWKAYPTIGSGGLSGRVGLRVENKAPAAKTAKELEGVLTAELLSDPRRLVVVNDPLEAVGKTVVGERGATVKVLSVRKGESELLLRVQVRLPEGLTANDAYLPPTAEIQTLLKRSRIMSAVGRSPEDFGGFTHGITLHDRKGAILQVVVSRNDEEEKYVFRVRCGAGKSSQAARLVLSGRMRIAVAVPFRLENAPLSSAEEAIPGVSD